MNNLPTAHVEPILHGKGLTKVFTQSSHPTTVLQAIDFSLYPNERIAIMGASGIGKSTLLHILGGLDHATEGAVQVLDHVMTDAHPSLVNQIRNRYIGFVHQFHHLLPEFTLAENVAMPLLIQKVSTTIAQRKALDLLHQIGLLERANYRPTHVSGGERQRTAIARAMITQPLFILADEPTGNLDTRNAHSIMDLLLQFDHTSMVIATHDDAIAQRMDKILRLENGRLIPVEHQ